MNETQSKLKTLQDSFNELLDENKNLKVKIHEKSNEIYDIQNSETIQLLYNTISDFSNNLNNKSVDGASIISNSVPELVTSLRNIAITFNKSGSVLSDVFSNLTQQFIYLLNQAKDNDQHCNELLNEIDKLKKEIKEINSKLEEEKKNNNELTETNKVVLGNMDQVTNINKNLKEKINSYLLQIQDKNNQITNLSSQIGNMNKQLTRMKPDSLVESLQQRIQEGNVKLETIGNEYRKIECENSKLKTSIKSINDQYSTARKESKERSLEISVLKSQFEKEVKNYEELKNQQVTLLEEVKTKMQIYKIKNI
ncbi:hypothetical protein H8356DRAFT_1274451 [Neocallimastix lanati (nom. inval.)]|nr:hypothetical protein H8356DRAFT_1274451 [Neocallimastix sp. JGI-2020a]